MKKIFSAVACFLESGSWKNLVLLKICLCALGVLVGLAMPARHKRAAAWTASAIFAASYIPLMANFLPYLIGEQVKIEDIYSEE